MFMMKSQSAMEYLMTYGWAILIIAVALAVLFQMGVFSGGNFTPKAQAGSCQVQRSAAGVSLEGQCNGMLPEFAAQFNGASSNIIVGNPAVLNPTTAITVTGWADLAPTENSWIPIVAKGQDTQYELRFYGTSSPYNIDLNIVVGGTRYTKQGSIPIYSGTWYFFAGTYGGGTVTTYVNGVRDYATSGATGSIATTTSPLYIGARPGAGEFINGEIADVQIYNTSLSQAEITALYQEGIGGAPINPNYLVGWWPLNGNANDYSGNNNNGAGTNVGYSGSWQSGYTAP